MSINKIVCLSFVLFALSSCANEWFITHNGNMPSNEKIEQVKTGLTKEEVVELLGSPSSVVSLDRNTWIYMSSEVKQVAFFKPEEISRDVLTITFDQYDQVENVERLSQADGKKVKISKDSTSNADQRGFFEKYFGGIGQYMPFPTQNTSARY